MRVLFVHAHPDDETITTGGTLAALVARGVDVRVLTCTLGEEGEVLGDDLAGLVADRADQLGGYRISEVRAALARLGAGRPRFLGGAGRWRDSGMAGTPSAAHPRAFVGSGDAALAELVAELDDFRPDLVVTYDPVGGYGHPDHIRAHELVHAAVHRCASPPARIAWTVTAASALEQRHPDPPAPTRGATPGELPGVPDAELTHVVRLDETDLQAKLDALAEHATQLRLVGGPDGRWWFALTNRVLQPVPAAEWYVAHEVRTGPRGMELRRCAPGAADLLDGLTDGRS